MTFIEKLRMAQAATHSRLVIGLDPNPDIMPRHLLANSSLTNALLAFNTAIINATHDVACGYKLNAAFYEACGSEGWRALERTIARIDQQRLIILDGKRGDIGNTADRYAHTCFNLLNCDACTVTPYMGSDAITPFLKFPGKAAFVLTLTSNPGAADFELLPVDGKPLYLHVAEKAAALAAGAAGTLGIVVGATRPEAFRELRDQFPDMPFLIPGIGAQGGDARAVMRHATPGESPVLINSSRAILYASAGHDFAEAAREQAIAFRDSLKEAAA